MDQIRERFDFLPTHTNVGRLSSAASHAPRLTAQAVVFELVLGAVEVERRARSDGMFWRLLARTSYDQKDSDRNATQQRRH